MQFPTSQPNTPSISLGDRRAKSDLARSLDLSWGRVASDCARSRAYPSPPMSGSPPLPPSRNPDSSDRGHGGYGSSGQDSFQGNPTPQPDRSDPRAPPLRPYQPDASVPATYAPYRMEEHQPILLPYQQRPPPPPQLIHQHPHSYQQPHSQPPAPFPIPDRPPTGDRPGFSASPKAQRKTKGHVAAACVPCKRAHLRCDSQRPCSRCMSNGKEDNCVDVQHKKRGRPRLRDEREERYESMGSGYAHPPDTSMRRQLSAYPSSDVPMNANFGDSIQASGQPYRILKSQGGQIAPRYPNHASSTDPNMFSGPIVPAQPILPLQEHLCAYLTMEMQVAKVAQGFMEAVGVPSIVSRKLEDLVVGNDREKLGRLQRIFEDERRQREPKYLPPIFHIPQEDRAIQSVGFGPDDMVHIRLDHSETLTFQGPEGQQRTLQGQFGLSKKDTTYFIVLVLHASTTQHPYPQPSSSSYLPYSREPHPRESQYGYQTPQQTYTQSQPQSSFMVNPGLADPRGDSMSYRPPGPPGPNIHPPASMSPFSRPQMRPNYSQHQTPYQTPRSELQPGPLPQQQHLQLPPIRSQRDDASSTEAGRRRDDRSSRVAIGGLLETPFSTAGR